MSDASDNRREWREAEEQDRLFDAWNLRDDWQKPKQEVAWPEHLQERFKTTPLTPEKWGVFRVRDRLFDLLDGARIIHRGDAFVWESGRDASYQIAGDLDVCWKGRSPIVEVKAYLPSVRQNKDHKPFPPAQGLDAHVRERYAKEQEDSGRPFYVIWVWPAQVGYDPQAVVARGQRIDRLPLDLKDPSYNRTLKKMKIPQDHWTIASLLTVSQIAGDIEDWGGAPYQERLAA